MKFSRMKLTKIWMFPVNLFCKENFNFLHIFLGKFVIHCNQETLVRSSKECRAYSGQTGSSCNRPSFDKNLREWLSSQSDSCHLGKSQMGDRATCAHCSSWRNFGSISSSCKQMYQNSRSKSVNQLVDKFCALVYYTIVFPPDQSTFNSCFSDFLG